MHISAASSQLNTDTGHKNRMENKQRKNDVRLIGLLLFLAVVLFLGSVLWKNRAKNTYQIQDNGGMDAEQAEGTGQVASISIDGREVLRLSLDMKATEQGTTEALFMEKEYVTQAEDGSFYVYADGISKPEGGLNVLSVKEGKIECTHADCPDQVCVRTGRISLETETIVCLPHRMIVRILPEAMR